MPDGLLQRAERQDQESLLSPARLGRQEGGNDSTVVKSKAQRICEILRQAQGQLEI